MRLWWLVLLVGACNDLHGFTGAWRGQPLASPAVRLGVDSDAQAVLTLDDVERNRVSGSLALGGATAPMRALTQAGADALGELSLPDGPLRTYLVAAALPDGDVLAFISLYDDRVDLRLVRGDTLYAVFRLHR